MTGETDDALSTGRGRRLSIHLPPTAHSPGAARSFVTEALRSWSVPAELAGDIVLAASELVTNAVEHGSGEITVELRMVGGCVRLKVRDDAGAGPVLRRPDPRSPRGRGLALIEALSAAWGHHRAEGGKWVWAEFRLNG